MLIAGIFVGGRARRMGGVAKGLLSHPTRSGTILDHVAGQAQIAGADVVLVGDHEAYRGLGFPRLEDAVRDVGPAGGLLSLLRHASGGIALALACDMPHVPASLLIRMVDGVERGAPAVVPLRDGRLEPLCAAYRAEQVAKIVAAHLQDGVRSLHRIARAAGADELVLSDAEATWLDDWDTPTDVAKHRT
jgi:molybdopterin-guanine dinucleotide biosynthesis protein A